MSTYEPKAIFTAIKMDSADFLSDVMKANPDVNIIGPNGLSPLMMAISMHASNSCTNAMVKILLENKADVNMQIQGFTPLMLATQEGLLDIAAMLIEHGADINAKNNDHGLTALMIAARDGHIAIIELLISKGVDISAQTKMGSTALMMAQQAQQKQAEALLKNQRPMNEIPPEILSKFIVLKHDKDGKLL